jgi:glutamate synthase domain-containing protein 3/thioredoxin reductase/Pyruvate/2-oxoacid:ferredoxin oxidoreductase delta subunit
MEGIISTCRIEVGKMHYRDLNFQIRKKIQEGVRHFILENVTGQRYIGASLDPDVLLEVRGIPGQDLGVFNGGAKIIVYGNAQDGVGNTMNGGSIVVHGSVGDIPGHMVRNGKIFVKGSAGFRAGIMMKEYGSKHPVMIIGETIGDYVGEYMAGGTIIILGCGLQNHMSPVSRHVASGMFGGEIYVRGKIEKTQLGAGAVMAEARDVDIDSIRSYLAEYASEFEMDTEEIMQGKFFIIRRAGQRPYGNLYVPSSKVSRELRPVHKNLLPPCANACPAGIPNPLIIRLLKEGKVQAAFDLVDEYTPFRYSCCGMVCPGLCRAACTRNRLGAPVKIDEIARQYSPSGGAKPLEGPKEELVGVIGAGPSGLTAAWHLARRGYRVDVYERESDIGGKLTHSIPEDRLSRYDIQKDLERIKSLGIQFHTGTTIDAARFAEMRERYDAVIIAVGAQTPRKLGFPGEDQTISSYLFLRSVKTGTQIWHLKDKKITIVGAGNVAMDAASECFRLGAESVTAVDIQRPAAFGKELDRALSLGTKIVYPRYIEKYQNGVLFFKNGERVSTDIVIEAIGEIPELSFAGERLVFEKDSFTTNLPNVYITGDVVAPGLVTHSIGRGRRVAEYIHCTFRGMVCKDEAVEVVNKRRINTVYFQQRDAYAGFLDDCFSCGTCVQCDICVDNCPRGAISRTGEIFSIDYDICSGCGVCASVCPRGAITMEPVKEASTERSAIEKESHPQNRERRANSQPAKAQETSA